MTSPVELIKVDCPRCRTVFEDWHRGWVNLDLEGWDPDDPEVAEYLRKCETATCPTCTQVIELRVLVVKDGVWHFPPEKLQEGETSVLARDGRETEAGRRHRDKQAALRAYAEIAAMEAALRERFGDDHDLLRSGVFRGTLWLQAASYALYTAE